MSKFDHAADGRRVAFAIWHHEAMMLARFLALISCLAAAVFAFRASAAQAVPTFQFREHLIEADIPGGYHLEVADLNNDGRPDVIGLSSRGSELYWYENPGWQRHLIVGGRERMINVAAADLNGDGIPELALATHFSSTYAKSEGLLFLLRHQGDPREPWEAAEFDRLPTSHRVQFGDIDGDGEKELVNSPLLGAGAERPLFDATTPLVFYRPGEWERETISELLDGVVHGMRTASWDQAGREVILTASFGGVWLHRSTGAGTSLRWEHARLTPGDPSARPNGGASEIRAGRGRNGPFLATIEPWHGHQVVIYTPGASAHWVRRVIDTTLDDGHAIEVADFNGDGLDEVVAGFRGEASSVYLYFSKEGATENWQRLVIDGGGMASAACQAEDMNSDQHVDLVCIGSRTANVKWYENLAPGR